MDTEKLKELSADELLPLPELIADMKREIGCAGIEDDGQSDNFAIALCTTFSDHYQRPKDDPENERGWGDWVEAKADAALDLAAREAARVAQAYARANVAHATAGLRERIAAAREDAARLRAALLESAQSLRTIANGAGKQEYLDDFQQVRGYALGRSNAAYAAMQEKK